MLKTRVLLAVCGVVPLLALLFLLPPWGWQSFVAVMLVITAWELLRLAGLPMERPVFAALLLLPVAAILISLLMLSPDNQWVIIYIGCLCWLVLLWWLTQPSWLSGADWPPKAVKIVIAMIFIVPAGLALTRLQAAGPLLVLAFFTLIWAADIAAYFTGKAIGGRKLAPRISPGKTIAGLAGGIVGSMLVVGIWYGISQPPAAGYLSAPLAGLLVTACIVLISVGGDLLASLLKRQADRKDSSHLLPGHGGLVDRLDSLLAAAPFYAVCIHHAGLA